MTADEKQTAGRGEPGRAEQHPEDQRDDPGVAATAVLVGLVEH